jgi:hypothetical protein
MNASIYEIGNWVNSSTAAITSNLYLVNNTIFTAVTAVGLQLNMTGNNINSSMVLMLNQSIELSALWNSAYFRNSLTWSNNVTDVLSQVYNTRIVNEFRNESMILYMNYNGQVEQLKINALATIESIFLPRNTSYRLWSVTQQEYKTDWIPLSINATDNDSAILNFGFYQELVGPNPQLIGSSSVDLAVIVAIFVIAAFVAFLTFRTPSERTPLHRAMKRNKIRIPEPSSFRSGNPVDDQDRYRKKVGEKK